jgi:hypothetical protein
MSKLDIINTEITRRRNNKIGLETAQDDLQKAIVQFNELDEFFRSQEKDSRESLECYYLENRHFSGEWPIVYSFADVEKRPYFGGPVDSQCNPYFPVTKVQDGTFDGLSPLFASPDRTGAHQRQRSYPDTEDTFRDPALVQLLAFPDISNEPLPANWPDPAEFECTGETPPGSGIDEATCLANGGTWGAVADPVWNGPDTAPALLRVPLQAWRDDIAIIVADLCNDTGGVEEAFWQTILDDIDLVLANVATDAVFVRATGNPNPAAWGQTQPFTGAVETARLNLISAAQTGIPGYVSARSSYLQGLADSEEQIFFGLIKLRLHQANGSYSKLQSAKDQVGQTDAIIDDHESAIALLNVMKVKNS